MHFMGKSRAAHCLPMDTPRTRDGHPTAARRTPLNDTPRTPQPMRAPCTPYRHPTNALYTAHRHPMGSQWTPDAHPTNTSRTPRECSMGAPWVAHVHSMGTPRAPHDTPRTPHRHHECCIHPPSDIPWTPHGHSLDGPRTPPKGIPRAPQAHRAVRRVS